MLANMVLAWLLAWEAGLGLVFFNHLLSDAASRRGLRWGWLSGLPLAFLFYRYRWLLGGREILDLVTSVLLVALLVLVLGVTVRDRRGGRVRRPLSLWAAPAAGFLLPQTGLWDLARWPFKISPLPANTMLTTELLAEVGGIVLGLGLATAGLAVLSLALSSLRGYDPERRGDTCSLIVATGLGAYGLKHLLAAVQILFAWGILPLTPAAFRVLVPLVNLLPRFSDLLLLAGVALAVAVWRVVRRQPEPPASWRPPQRRQALAPSGGGGGRPRWPWPWG